MSICSDVQAGYMALQVLAILWIAKYDLQVSASEGREGDSEKLCSVSMEYWGSTGDQSKTLPYKHSRVHARAQKRSFSISPINHPTTGIASCWQLPVSSHPISPISAGGRPERENQYSRRSKTCVLRVKNLLGLTGGICRNKQQHL
jgi:hypothetical protein